MAETKECAIMIGIPGAGKSTFCFKYFFDTHIRINLDMLRTRNREKKVFESCLDATQSCVVDNTNITIEERRKYIEAAKKRGFFVIGYYMRSSIFECLSRNARREGRNKVPNTAIASRYNKMEMPSLSEGFDKIYYVSIVNGEFSIDIFCEKTVEEGPKKRAVVRKISVPVSERIDWESIIESLALKKDIALELKEIPTIKRPLVLLELTGEMPKITEFSKEVHDKIEEAITNSSVYRFVELEFVCFRWSNKNIDVLQLASDMGLTIFEIKIVKSGLRKTMIYEVQGEEVKIKEFVEKTSPKASS